MTGKVVDVIVIGAGTAGLKAYKAATARGADTLIIERGPGGSTCTRCGCMPSKLLIAAARAAHQARQAGQFGIEVGAVRVDAAAVWQRVRRERDRFVASVLEEYHAIPDDRRLHGSARFDGANSVVVGGRRIEARRGIVIATGARPIIPDGFDDVRHLVQTHETIFERGGLPRSLAVLGAGPLGLELAQAFARLGVDVAVFDPGSTIAGLKDPDCNGAAIDAIGSEVHLHLETKAQASAAGGDRATLSWDGGELVVDCILAATGRAPAMQDLGLEDTGIALDDDGVPVFDRRSHRCGDSRIFVAGDADAWRPVLHEAARGGRIAGEVAAGGEPPRCLPAFSVAFTEPGIAQVGMAFVDLPPDARIGSTTVADNGRATVDGHTHGLVKLYGDRAGKLIGASIVAPDAEHLGHLVALGIDRDIDVATFADQAWYHPTLEEMLQSAARDLAGIED
ncbi:dihydrolipoyl dehydrogenase [Sphingomonas sp. NBWT7]|uniref:dihydrolipoyl dehydrogenase n=1 Tax=Sphingomonas sp. NBWT7 TaxID=2596913 RepID=UPI001861A83D|nr:dihydrolipoyl dehydrogenase [Sphingomonas sp. NBWT7]QNE32955.1 dihydrolipoyl dehydrogenase [Sphingomonas sp. NBWT7]